jgi:hypothetical protein
VEGDLREVTMAVKMGYTVIRHFDDGVFCGHYIERNNRPLLGSHTIDHPSHESDWIWARRFIREQAAIISTADLDLLASDIRRSCALRHGFLRGIAGLSVTISKRLSWWREKMRRRFFVR